MESIIIFLPIGAFSTFKTNNSLRLVMPPTLFIVLAYPWYKLAHMIFPYYIALAVYSGGIAGYISYDMTHYFLHHRKYFFLLSG
jgi:sterol desaturase/sphingolipid hydroxylase (fatty acid hydroxylase superfamily)